MPGMGLLWFRRSKKDGQHEADSAPEPAAPFALIAPAPPPHPRAQTRGPLRLRGLLLLNLAPTDGLEQIEKAPPLGRRDEVIARLRDVVPGMTFDADGRGEFRSNDCRLTLDLGRGNLVDAAVAAADGDEAVELLRSVMERQRWRAYAPRAGVFIEPDALDLFGMSDEIRSDKL
jgi:hypothetical protein